MKINPFGSAYRAGFSPCVVFKQGRKCHGGQLQCHSLKPILRRILDSRCRSSNINHYPHVLLSSESLLVTSTSHPIGTTNVHQMSLRKNWPTTETTATIHFGGWYMNKTTRQGSLRCIHHRGEHERSKDPRSPLDAKGISLRKGVNMCLVDGECLV